MKQRIKIVPGLVFHRLTVVGLSHVRIRPSGARISEYLCKCQCGGFSYVGGGNLTGSHPVKSCGCLNTENLERIKKSGRTHGLSKTRVWQIWVNVRARGEGREQKEKYFDRGIRVCKRWRSFENFLCDMGMPDDGQSIDRIDNNKGYYKENCRWADNTQQARNTRKTVYVDREGVKVPLSDLADEHHLKPSLVRVRVKKLGWSVERALTTPVRKNHTNTH